MRAKGNARQRGRRIPEVLTPDEQEALLTQPNPRYPTGERNRLLLSLMLDTGLRLSEAIGLQWRDLDLISGKLFVRQGKGAKDRSLWIGEIDLEAVRQWRKRQIQAVGHSCADVFTTLAGSAVSGRYVQQMVKRCAARAGLDKHVHPHLLRHTFATDLYRQTGRIRLVQKALGHSDLSTTMIYTHVYDQEVEEAMRMLRTRRGRGVTGDQQAH